MDTLIPVKLLILAMLLVGCANQTAPLQKYQVVAGDTLHSIARKYQLDHRELGKFNQLAPPYYELQVGQTLYISAPVTRQDTRKSAKPRPMRWIWPAKNKIVKKLSAGRSATDGIDISNTTYSVAAAAGKVIYAGISIRGYGNLVILEHDDDYISAYSSPQTIIVKEGQQVRQGRRLMQIKRKDKKQNASALHFEIHHLNRPLDPRKYLSAKGKSKSRQNRFWPKSAF